MPPSAPKPKPPPPPIEPSLRIAAMRMLDVADRADVDLRTVVRLAAGQVIRRRIAARIQRALAEG